MRLLRHVGTVATAVNQSRFKKLFGILKCSESDIACAAKQPANHASCVVVVNVKKFALSASSLWRGSAYSASATLLRKHSVVLVVVNAIVKLKGLVLLAPRFTFKRLASNFFHASYGGEIGGGSSSVRILFASRDMANNFPGAEVLSAPFTRSEYPSTRAGLDLPSVRMIGLGLAPFFRRCFTAVVASISYSRLAISMGVKFIIHSNFLAPRASLLVSHECREFSAFACPVFLNTSSHYWQMAPAALYRRDHGSLRGRFGQLGRCDRNSPVLNSFWHQPQGTSVGGLPPGCLAGNFCFMRLVYDKN
jgi:hypothetical protein